MSADLVFQLESFIARRQRLLQQMVAQSALLLPAATLKVRNRDSEYPFRQDSDFLYLTGYPEPGAWLLLEKRDGGTRTTLFVLPREPEKEIWTGYRIGPERAAELFGFDQALALDQLDGELEKRLAPLTALYAPFGRDVELDQRLFSWRRMALATQRDGGTRLQKMIDSSPLLHAERLIKHDDELDCLRRAAQVSAAAHRRAMRVCRPGLMEYQLQAEIEHEFAMQGCRSPAYGTIVGGGANACILHYVENRAELADGDLVLIDAGCEAEGYAGDITRTFPVNGRFTPEQRQLYQLVLDAQLAAIAQIRAGSSWNAPHEAAVTVLVEGLVRLGLLVGEPAKLIADESYRRFYMHRTGHWLGLDVHDVGDYKIDDCWRALEPNMVLTVEPGLYIAPDDETVEPRWRGIGIRIEDDVRVTAEGCEVLTAAAPKSLVEIEQLMAKDV